MALLLDVEPPSSREEDNNKQQNLNINQTTKVSRLRQLLNTLNLYKRLSFLYPKWFANLQSAFSKTGINALNSLLKSFYSGIIGNRYLPHFTISILFLAVVFANVNDKAKAYFLTRDYNNLDPDIELSITDDIDPYTPLVDGDAGHVEKANLASAYSDGFAVNTAPVATKITARVEPLPDNSKESVYYLVRTGDTLTGLGWKFDVKLATLRYVNDIYEEDLIKPGQRLKIPSKGYEVSSGTITAWENEHDQKLAQSRNTVTRSYTTRTTTYHRPGTIQNAYPFGWCTYYVATRRAIPAHWGNAGQWLYSAQRDGYATGSGPSVGAVVVTNESWYGHVAYVESVNGNEITVSEMNAPIWGVVTHRTLNAYDGRIKGYIY